MDPKHYKLFSALSLFPRCMNFFKACLVSHTVTLSDYLDSFRHPLILKDKLQRFLADLLIGKLRIQRKQGI